jgi:hypothetical protein
VADHADLRVMGSKGCGQYVTENKNVHETSENLALFLLRSILLAIRVCR